MSMTGSLLSVEGEIEGREGRWGCPFRPWLGKRAMLDRIGRHNIRPEITWEPPGAGAALCESSNARDVRCSLCSVENARHQQQPARKLLKYRIRSHR